MLNHSLTGFSSPSLPLCQDTFMTFKIKSFPLLPLFFIIIVLCPRPTAARVYDRIVAVVNNEAITRSELKHRANPVLMRMTTPDPPDPTAKDYKRQVLLNLIERRLMVQKAKATGIAANDQYVDSYIRNMIADSGRSMEDFKTTLKETGIDFDDYRRGIKENIAYSRLIHFEVRSKIVITDAEAQKFYQKNYLNSASMPEGVHLLQMGFYWNHPHSLAHSREEARKRAEEIRNKIEKGADFKELARRFSELPSAANGGDLNFLKPGEMAPWMLTIIKGKKPGDITTVVEGAGAMQFFLVFAKNIAGKSEAPPFTLVKNEIKKRLISLRERNPGKNG